MIVDPDELEARARRLRPRCRGRYHLTGATSRSCAATPPRPPAGQPQARRAALPALARWRSSPDANGHLGAVELARNGLVAGAAAPARAAHRGARDDLRAGSSSARSATAASRSPASPSTSARGHDPQPAPDGCSTPTPGALAGEYVVGWIKRGPSGVIGTNKKDAQETVNAILATSPADGDRSMFPPNARRDRGRGAAARAPARARHLRRLGIDRPPRARARRAPGRPR